MEVTWWDGHPTHPRWTPLTPADTEDLLGTSLDLTLPVWRPRAAVGWLGCTVGPRHALVHASGTGAGQALVDRDDAHGCAQQDLATMAAAQGWALDALAGLAAEYDTWPG